MQSASNVNKCELPRWKVISKEVNSGVKIFYNFM